MEEAEVGVLARRVEEDAEAIPREEGARVPGSRGGRAGVLAAAGVQPRHHLAASDGDGVGQEEIVLQLYEHFVRCRRGRTQPHAG